MIINSLSKRCLLILPKSFYSYSEHLQKALLVLGYDATISNHEYPDSVIGKIMGKLHIPFLLPITDKIITKKFLNDVKYDVVWIIKGRGISISLINKLKQISPKVIGYTFDSFKYHSAPLKWMNYVNNFYSFDYRDAENYNLSIVELFSSMPDIPELKLVKYNVSAILRNHSARLKYIDKVFMNIPVENRFIYIFEQNIFTFALNFIENPFLYLKYNKFIFFKPLSFDSYVEVMNMSNFTIDFAHPAQTGITLRCFDALSSQTKIITNNSYVTRNKQFNEKNTIIFNGSSDPNMLKDHYNKIYDHTPAKYKRTIYNFINDLITE